MVLPLRRDSGCDVIASLPEAGLKGVGRRAGWRAYPYRHAFLCLFVRAVLIHGFEFVGGGFEGRGGGDGYHAEGIPDEHAGRIQCQYSDRGP